MFFYLTKIYSILLSIFFINQEKQFTELQTDQPSFKEIFDIFFPEPFGKAFFL